MNQRLRLNTQNDEVEFPGTNHVVKTTKRVALNGTVHSFECIFPPLADTVDALREYCKQMIKLDPQLKYNLVTNDHATRALFSIPPVGDSWDYDHAKLVYNLTPLQIGELKGLITSNLNSFLLLFSSFYAQNLSRTTASTESLLTNDDFDKFFRKCGDAKIRGLSELTNLYVAITIILVKARAEGIRLMDIMVEAGGKY